MTHRMPPTDADRDDVDAASMSHGSADDSRPMPANDLPPSCRCVLQALKYHGPKLTRQELLEETGLPERTLDGALKRCETRGYLHRARKSGDVRQTVAILATL